MTARTPLTRAAAALGEIFRAHGFTADGVAAHLGPAATAAMHRGEPGAVHRRLVDGTALSRLIALFILRDEHPADQVRALVGAAVLDELAAAGAAEIAGGRVRMLIDVRPHVIAGVDRWVFSDADASFSAHVPGPDHVLGVGAASLSLLHATPASATRAVLDLGTGSGVLALGQLECAGAITATDIHPRALDFAEASLAASGQAESVELLEGPWFEPVAGRKFSRIVANPPFVVGSGEVGHVYRDSGLHLDGATELVVGEAARHLEIGGTAYILGAWAHTDSSSWRQRVASWVPDHGVEGWVLQRDVADPEHYVGTWLRDESIDPRSKEGAERTRAWLDHFARAGVTGVGFGFIALRRLPDSVESQVTAEELTQPFSDPLGPEIEEYFIRAEWLRDRDSDALASARYRLRPQVAREEIAVADVDAGSGFTPAVTRLTRTDGPRFSHEVDELLATLVAGLNPRGLSLADTAEILAAARGLDADTLTEAALPAVVDLVRHGLLIPADVVKEDD